MVKLKNIYFKSILEDSRHRARRETRSVFTKCKLYLIRVIINLIVFSMLGGAGYLIYFTTMKSTEVRLDTKLAMSTKRTMKIKCVKLASVSVSVSVWVIWRITNRQTFRSMPILNSAYHTKSWYDELQIGRFLKVWRFLIRHTLPHGMTNYKSAFGKVCRIKNRHTSKSLPICNSSYHSNWYGNGNWAS